MNETFPLAGPPSGQDHGAPTEAGGQGVFRADAGGVLVFVDQRAAQILDYAPEDLMGRNFAELFFESDLPQARQKFDQRRLGVGGVTEYPMRRKDGAAVWVAVASAPTLDAGGAFLGITGFVTDVDARRRQEALSAHECRLLRQIAGNYPLAAVLEDLCSTLEAVSRRPLRATVMLANGDSLKCVAAPSLPPEFRSSRVATRLEGSGTACAEAVRSGRKVVVGDTARALASPEIVALWRQYGVGAVWSYPIEQDAQILGTLALLLSAPGEPEAQDEQAIEFAIQVARLALARERDARSRYESEQRFRDFADMAADWFWEQDADLRFSRLSGGVYNTEGQGVRVADILGKRRWELPIEGVDETRWAAHRELLARREVFADFVYSLRVADGSWRWYSVSGKPVFAADGEFLGYRGSTHDITERQRAEDALRESEQCFRDYAELSADWFWEQDAEFRFTDMSGGVFNKGGFRVVDSLGKTRWELPIVGFDAAQWAAHRALLERREVFHDLTYSVRVADGTLHWYSVSGKPVFGPEGEFLGYRGIGRDITQQVTASEKLEKTRRWLEQAVRAANIGLWERDVETWVFRFTENWKELFGYAEDEIGNASEDFDRLVHPDDLARIHAFARTYLKDPQVDYENRFRVRHRDGSWRWVLSRGTVLTDPVTGRRTLMGCHIDITDQWRVESQVRELAATLEARVKARTAELEASNRELDAFNFSVSHDLRTPLRAIEGFSQALLEDYHAGFDEAGRDYLRRIGAATTRMSELIEALYELSRLSRAPLRPRPVDLSATARELAAELNQHEPGRAVEIEIEETPPAEGDARLLRIVLGNLLGNAWKFTARAAPARIIFGARRDEQGRVEYFVRDNGAGFDMQFADKLFRLFHRLHREDEFSGQGIGLTTVQRIITRHGGSIRGEAERGAGATFCFTLWVDPAQLAEAKAAVELG